MNKTPEEPPRNSDADLLGEKAHLGAPWPALCSGPSVIVLRRCELVKRWRQARGSRRPQQHQPRRGSACQLRGPPATVRAAAVVVVAGKVKPSASSVRKGGIPGPYRAGAHWGCLNCLQTGRQTALFITNSATTSFPIRTEGTHARARA